MSRKPSRITAPLGLLALTLGAGCAQPMLTPSAYASERDLCAPGQEAALAAELEACRAARAAGEPCGGVVSFHGTLEGQPVVVDAHLDGTTLTQAREPDSGDRVLEEARTHGRSPYFQFVFDMKSVGGRMAEGAARPARTLLVQPGAEDLDGNLEDAAMELSLRLAVGSESVDLMGQQGGSVTVASEGLHALSGTFDSGFGTAGDRVAGCFHLLADRVLVSTAVAGVAR
jgi:hypothetical protein